MPKGAKFLVTTKDASDPQEARRLLRKTEGYDTLAEAINAGMGTMDGDSFELPEGAVLLMIGNTEELQTAVAAATGLSYLYSPRSYDDGVWRYDLDPYFVRMEISSFGPVTVQTDTLLAIGSKKYWRGKMDYVNEDGWHHLDDKRGEGSYRIYNGGTTDDKTSLQWMIEECKRQAKTGWVTKED